MASDGKDENSAPPLYEFDDSVHLGGKGKGEDDAQVGLAGPGMKRMDVKQPVKKANWAQMGAVMIADVVGVGVLSLAGAMSKVGWVLGLLMLFGFFPLNVYTGILLSRTRKLLPKSVTMSDMALYTMGRAGMVFVALYVYLDMFFILGDYLLVGAQSLGMIFYDHHICKPVWAVICAVIIFIIMQFSRTLHHASYIAWFNMASITISIFIALIYLWAQGVEASLDGSYTQAVASGITIQIFFQAMSSYVFAYSGQFMYLELMAEMKQPDDFPKTFLLAGPYQIAMFTLVSCTGYAYKGVAVSGFIIDNLPYGPTYRAASVFLFLHMLVVWIIKGQVLSRAIHIVVHPPTGNDFGIKGKLVWATITFVVLALNWVLTAAIPFFDYFTSLLGAFGALPTLIFPAVFFILARIQQGVNIPILDWITIIIFCIVGGVLLIIFGMWGSIDGITSSYNTLGGAFACHCSDIWSSGCPAS